VCCALSNASQDKGGKFFTQELLIKGANAAALRLREHVSLHMNTKQAGDFSIEALCDAVSLTNHYTMQALSLSPQLEALRDSPPHTVLDFAFSCIRGLPVVGLLMHLPSGHYVALRRDSAVAPLSAIVLDSLCPESMEVFSAEQFCQVAMAERKTSVGRAPMFTILQLLEGGQAEHDEAAELHANAGVHFDTRHTPGEWVNNKWAPTQFQ
jgi:hypothetical protein